MRHRAIGENGEREIAFRVTPQQRSRMTEMTECPDRGVSPRSNDGASPL